jgi:hypothetical protein
MFGSPTIPSSSIGLSINKLGPTTLNVNDGVCCLSSTNYVPRNQKPFIMLISMFYLKH